MKVSFDFDSTLTTEPMQRLCKLYLSKGFDVYITTSRFEVTNNNDLFKLADELGIKKENIRFTNMQQKYLFLKDFDIHYDDDDLEIMEINGTDCVGVCVGYKWVQNGILYEPNN
jgi:uncharacterized NAD-dependent epimerase/dehydratase family protein